MTSTPKSFPHYRVNVIDNSIVDVAYNEVLPVHRPCYVMRAQRGEINKLIWCPTYAVAEETFGSETFNPLSPYFSLQALYLKNTLTYNGAFIMRVADDTAVKSAIILEAIVETEVDIPQYAVDELGNRIKERNPTTGALEYVKLTTTETQIVQGPIVDEYGQPVIDEYTGLQVIGDIEQEVEVDQVEPGVRIRWRTRAVSDLTELDNLEADATDGVYPIMAFEALGAGVYGDNLAFSLFYEKSQNSITTLNDYKSVFYSFEAAERGYGNSTITPIRSNYGSVLPFAANADAINPITAYSYNMEGVLTRAFNNSKTKLPYNIYTYEENIRAIGNIVAEYELNGETLTNGGLEFIDAANYTEFEGVTYANGTFSVEPLSVVGSMVNIISGININGVSYDHLLVDLAATNASAVYLQNKSYVFLQDGADGDLNVDEYIKQFFQGNLPADGSIVDKFRYPFTHIYDTGFSMDIKMEMLDFLEIRDDIGIEVATQATDVNSLTWNTRATDEENGQFLRARALLQRESITNGTDCCRCSIYPQAGILADGSYTGVVPFTFWSAMKHAMYGNTTRLSAQEPRGLPHAANEYFKAYNWLNFDEGGQARVWDAGLNYCQAADMARIFYPALRTVYRADTSVLTDQWFVDAVIYTKHVVRQAWATHVGRNDKSAVLNNALQTYLSNALTNLYNGKYMFDVSVTQTEEERKLGYVRHALIRIYSPSTFRVLEVDVEVNREIETEENA